MGKGFASLMIHQDTREIDQDLAQDHPDADPSQGQDQNPNRGLQLGALTHDLLHDRPEVPLHVKTR